MIEKVLQTNLIERKSYIDNISKWFNTPLIKIIIGQRRVGKSSILKSVIKKLYEEKTIPKENFFYINKERPIFRDIKNYEDLNKEFEKFLKTTKKGRIFIGIDEVQDIEGWEKFVRGYLAEYETKAEIFITGSNSFLVSGKLATYLTGRTIEFPIFPLSFEEFCLFKKGEQTRQNFLEYMKYGGLPGIFTVEYDEEVIFDYLLSIYDTIIVKDIIQYHSIQNISFFKDLYKFVFANIGKIISGKKIKDYLKNQNIRLGNDTVLNFLHYGEEAFLLNKVYSVNPNSKKIFDIYNKYFIGDIGLRNSLVGFDVNKNMGGILENFVYFELRRNGWEVKIGRLDDGKEIDFIAEKRGIIKYFQVCYLLNSEETIEREYTSLEKIKDNWEKYVVSFDELDFGVRNGVRWINVMELGNVLSLKNFLGN